MELRPWIGFELPFKNTDEPVMPRPVFPRPLTVDRKGAVLNRPLHRLARIFPARLVHGRTRDVINTP